MNSTRRNESMYDSMEPLHNSTMRPSSRARRTARNNTTTSTTRNQYANATVMNNNDMICMCFKSPPVIMNKMPSRNNDCNCTCHMDRMGNNLDTSGIERLDKEATFNMSRSRQGNKSSLQELEETMKNMSNDFDETILEVQDDPSNVTPLGKFYRVNSFR
ncbi:hypothetical protein ACKWTF_006586 [Chironomus riparius]